MTLYIERRCVIPQTNIIKTMCHSWKPPVTPSTETDMRVLLIFSMRWGASKFKVVCCMSWFNTNCWERED
jgi:hypothetical protein